MKKDIQQQIRSVLTNHSTIIYVFAMLIPLTHKEMFSVYDSDLVWSKWMLGIVSFLGLYLFFRNYKLFKKDLFYFFLSSVVIGQLLSLFVSLDRVETVKLVIFQLAITFTYPFYRIYTNKNGYVSIFKSYLISFYFVFAFLVWQIIYHTYFNKLTGGIWPVPGYPTRYGSTFWDVNHFGAYVSSMIFLFLGCFFALKKQKNSWTYLFAAFLGFIALTFTDSRSATLGFIAGALLFGIFAFKERKFEKLNLNLGYVKYLYTNMWLLASASIISSTLLILYFLNDTIHKSFFYRSTSFFSHLYLLQAGTSLAFDNFMTGIGANAFYAYFKNSDWASAYYYIDRAAINYKLPLHNLWLEVLTETGLISFIIFSIMWIVGTGLLLRLFRQKNDFIALGFASGLVSFLVGGLFYSYKSEFFWIYVVCAFVYGSKDLDKDVIISKWRDVKEVFFYVFDNNYKFRKAVVITISLLSLLSLCLYIFEPVHLSELNYFYRSAYSINLYSDPFSFIINLLRFTLGNYSFTGRLIPLLFFFSTFIVFIGIFSNFVKFYKAVVLSSTSMSILAIIVPPTLVSLFYINIYFVAIFMFALLAFIFPKRLNYNFDYKILVGVLLIVSVFSHIAIFQRTRAAEYDSNLAFITELAANRSVFNGSLIWVDSNDTIPLVRYYSDHVMKVDSSSLEIESEEILTINNLKYINFASKNVFIVSELNKIQLEKSIMFDEVIKHRNYYVLITEPVTQMESGLK